MTDLISRADAVKTVIRKCSPICAWQVGTQQYPDCVVAEINALPSAELTLQTPQTYGKSINPSNAEVVEDYISRADAIDHLKNVKVSYPHADISLPIDLAIKAIEILPSAEAEYADLPDIPRAYYEKVVGNMAHEINMLKEQLESAEAEQTVIRSRTLMTTKDFKEWAKRVRETNPNVIVIPCDAEVVSADAVQIHNDGTLEVKVPNAQKVGRVLVMDTDSHIGGGLFYPESAEAEVREDGEA